MIIIAQNPSTQNAFVYVKKQIPKDYFLIVYFASLCLQLCWYFFLGVLSLWIFSFTLGIGNVLFLEIFFCCKSEAT
jgi:hypothetical protein